MPANPLAEKLIDRFRATFKKQRPKWAWPFDPSIPLVGDNFKPGKGVLVYASCENLAWMYGKPIPSRFKSNTAWNRYRAVYEASGKSSDSFFPNVGIQPVTDGGLFAAALFVAREFNLPTKRSPRQFLQTIAVSNWCKFTIKAETNRDYIGNLSKLTNSLAFVVGELAELRPAVVLLPRPLWKKRILVEAMQGASPTTRFVPIHQFNATVVNVHLKDFTGAGRRLQSRMKDSVLGEWMTHLDGFHADHRWRYMAYLADELDA